MLAISLSVLFALYILGPDQVSRFILGFTIPRRNVTLTRSEEIVRAVVWSLLTVFPAYCWTVRWGTASRLWSKTDAKSCFAGLYSEEYFRNHQQAWFDSLHSLLWLNAAILWRTYFFVFTISLVLTLLTRYYSQIRRCLGNWKFGKDALATIVLPRIAHWHILLSRLLPDSEHLEIHLDILTKSDNLYQGILADKVLSVDGSLTSLTLASPKRFQRTEYLKAKTAETSPKATDFWKSIPTNMFLIMGTEIQTVNFRYVPRSIRALRNASKDDELKKVLAALTVAVEAAQTAKRKSKLI